MVLLLLLPFALSAKTPEEVVRTYVELVRAEGMASVAKLTHPEELAKFQSMLEPVIEVAFGDERGREVFDVFADPAERTKPRKMEAEPFMMTFLQWVETKQPLIAEVLRNARFEVLGHVKEHEVSHVVVRARTSIKGVEIEKMDVVSVKDFRGEPRLMLSGEIKQLGETLRRSMKAARP